MKSITKEDYEKFKNLRTELNQLIIEKTSDMCLIMYDRLPYGECLHDGFVEENNRIFVQFENYECQDIEYDTFELPLEFLFDESYPEKFKLIWEDKKIKKYEEKIEKYANNIKQLIKDKKRKDWIWTSKVKIRTITINDEHL